MSSRAGYALGTLLLVAGVVAAVVFLLARFGALQDRLESFPSAALEGGAVELEARSYTVYLDVPSGADNGYRDLVILAPSNLAVPLQPVGGRVRYSVGGRSGYRIGRVELRQAGRYRVEGQGAFDARVIFGEGLGGGIVVTVLGTIAIAFLGVGSGLTLLIRTGVVRRRGRR